MRAFFALSLCVAMNAMNMSTALADPDADLTKMRDTFLALHSFHAEITTQNGSVLTIDSIRPDRIRAASNASAAIEIGSASLGADRRPTARVPGGREHVAKANGDVGERRDTAPCRGLRQSDLPLPAPVSGLIPTTRSPAWH